MSNDLLGPVEAALVILVPEVEPLVSPFRLEYDPSAAKGFPAHITINYPFLPGVNPDMNLDRALEELFGQADAFSFTFRRLARFPDILYLAPEPDTPFKQLVDLVAKRFPASPPYEGAFEEIIPHLTVAQFENEKVLQKIERELAVHLQEYLPLSIRATHVTLINNRAGMWQRTSSYPLGKIFEQGSR